ncbi:MAG: HAD hydrolase-like protein [Hyphomicrobiaceae bacterium]|nr:HAD hydrolase-like protein [Hyphomicrobiaceae bacterium]
MSGAAAGAPLDPAKLQLLSFDVFGTLISVRDSSYDAFRRILAEAGRPDVDVKAFWEVWEEANIEGYWQPYRPYKEICRASLAHAFAAFGVTGGDPGAIRHYFDAFESFELYPDVVPTLERLAARYRLAVVSNIDDDLLALTPLGRDFDLVCTAEKARGYKPDGTLFRYLLAQSGLATDEILHSGQSQFTDMVGAKPLGLTVAWINRRGITLSPKVPVPDYRFSDIASVAELVLGPTTPA